MKVGLFVLTLSFVIVGAAFAAGGQPIEGPRTYRLYSGITLYVDNDAGKDFAVSMDLRDLNIYANGLREVLFKVYDPDGVPLVREYIPDDGVTSKNYMPRIGGWDHELQYYALCYSKGTEPMSRWSAWSDPKRLATIAPRHFVRQIRGGKKGIYRILLVGERDHYATLTVDPALPYGVCGHVSWIHGHHDLFKHSYVYVPKGTTGLHIAFAEPDVPQTRHFTIMAPDGKTLFDGMALDGFIETNRDFGAGVYDDQILRIDVSDGEGDYLLRATMKRPEPALNGFGTPALLCKDEATARALRGGAIYADGEVFWHPWQMRFERWMKANKASDSVQPLLEEIRPYFRAIGPSDGRDAAAWCNWGYAMGYYGFKIWRPAWLLSKNPNTPAEVMNIIREACLMTGERASFALEMERVNGNAFAQTPVHLWYCQATTRDKMIKDRYDLWFERWRTEGWGEGVGISKSGDSQEHFAHDMGYGSYVMNNWAGKALGGGQWVEHGILSDTDDPRFQQVFDRMMNLFSYVYCKDVAAYPWNARITDVPVPPVPDLLKEGKFAWKGLPGPDLTVSVDDGDEWFAARRQNYYIVTFHGRLAPRWLTETFYGQIGFGGGCIAQLTVPGKGTVLNSHPTESYGKGMQVSNWRDFHIHGVVGEMWDGLPFAAGISEHYDAKLNGNVVTSSGNVRERNLRSIRKYTFGGDFIDCEVRLAEPGYQQLMTLWSHDRPYAHVREAYEMIPYAGGDVTLYDASGKSLGALAGAVMAKRIVVDRGKYGVVIDLETPLRVSKGVRQTIMVELVAAGGAAPTPAKDVALKYRLTPYRTP